MSGSGSPFTGTSPATIATLYTTWKANRRGDGGAEKGPHPVPGELGGLEDPPQPEEIEPEDHGHAEEAHLLGEHREDEVGVAGGQVAELGLAALAEPLAQETARAHRDLRLDLLVAGPAGIEGGVEEGVDARLLVVLERAARPGRRPRRGPGPARTPRACAGRPGRPRSGRAGAGRTRCPGRAPRR